MSRSRNERLEEALKQLEYAKCRVDVAVMKYEQAKQKVERIENGISTSQRLRILKERNGLTYEEIGRRIGVSRQRVEELFHNGRMSPTVLSKLADALGTTVGFLITGVE